MRCYRRMQKISWTDRITNKEVLERILETSWSLWKSIKRRRNEWMSNFQSRRVVRTNFRRDGWWKKTTEEDHDYNTWARLLKIKNVIHTKNWIGRPVTEKPTNCCKPTLWLKTAKETFYKRNKLVNGFIGYLSDKYIKYSYLIL